jgi:predicted ATPase/class 3 adenylate cyclase
VGAPSGNVTFLFTDIEGSTRLFQGLGEVFVEVLEAHRTLIRAAVAAHGGFEVKTEGDGFFIVFGDAVSAVEACVDAQRALTAYKWPPHGEVRVRMGLHTGVAVPTAEADYVALAVHQAARIADAGHGRQVLLSAETAGLVHGVLPPGTDLAERGSYVLKDFDEPQELYQLTHPDIESSFPPLRASPAMPHNLPDVRTSFVGRQRELATVEELISTGRLVSVVGSGGAGKTRLCLELAARLAAGFDAGATLSDLSPLTDPSLVTATVASVFGVRDTSGADLLEAVGRELAGRRALLVLDNCEHLVEAAAAAVDRLLALAPGLRVLATSREPLRVAGEQVWRIIPLAVPDVEAPVESVRACESVRLFEDRARLALPTFSVTEQNASAVASICRHLEGLPLGIELIASRVSAMSPSAVAARLDSQVGTVAVAGRRSVERHRSLEATIDWSYQLLAEGDRRVLRSLSIFAGGFTAQAVESVADTDQPVESLAGLVDRSLVVYAADIDRYRLLETIRLFARSRLEQSGESHQVGQRHLAWCAAFADMVYKAAVTSQEAHVFAEVDQEIDNVRAALTWAEQHRAVDGLTVVGRLLQYWFYRAPVEGRAWAERMLAATPSADPVSIGLVITAKASCTFAMGDPKGAIEASEPAVNMLRTGGDDEALQYALVYRANALFYLPDHDEAERLYLEASTLAARTGHPGGKVAVLINLSTVEMRRGNHQQALDYAERSLVVLRGGDFPASSQALVRMILGKARLLTGASPENVHPIFTEAFDWAAQTRSAMIVAWSLDALATTVTPSDTEAAAKLCGAATAIRNTHAIVPDEDDQAAHDGIARQIESRIGQQRTEELVNSVKDLSLDQAVQLARTITR